MAKQHTVIALDKSEVCEALGDYIKKHYGEEIDVETKDVFTVDFRGAKETLDEIEIVVETEDVEDIADEDDDDPREAGYSRSFKGTGTPSAGADIAFDALGEGGKVRPRAG